MFAADAVTDAITLDSFLVLTVISFVIPTLVGLITKASASPAVNQIDLAPNMRSGPSVRSCHALPVLPE